MEEPSDSELHRIADKSDAKVNLIRQLESNIRMLEAMPDAERAPFEDHIRQWRERLWPALRRELPLDEQ